MHGGHGLRGISVMGGIGPGVGSGNGNGSGQAAGGRLSRMTIGAPVQGTFKRLSVGETDAFYSSRSKGMLGQGDEGGQWQGMNNGQGEFGVPRGRVTVHEVSIVPIYRIVRSLLLTYSTRPDQTPQPCPSALPSSPRSALNLLLHRLSAHQRRTLHGTDIGMPRRPFRVGHDPIPTLRLRERWR